MSSTGRGALRMPDDFYRTPSAATRALIPHLGNVRSVLDPFCGDGAILAEFPSAERHGIEIDPVRAHLARHGTESKVALRDALDPGDWPRVDVIVTNPPFSLALPAINRMLAKAAEHGTDVVVLLRLNFMASQARATFHRANRSDIFVLPSRPSFAASLKCPACGWKATLDLRDERPKVCPTCGGGKITVTTSDSTDYGFFCWGPKRTGRWDVLETTHEMEAAQ